MLLDTKKLYFNFQSQKSTTPKEMSAQRNKRNNNINKNIKEHGNIYISLVLLAKAISIYFNS